MNRQDTMLGVRHTKGMTFDGARSALRFNYFIFKGRVSVILILSY